MFISHSVDSDVKFKVSDFEPDISCGIVDLVVNTTNSTMHKFEDKFELLLTKEGHVDDSWTTFDQKLLRCQVNVTDVKNSIIVAR